MRHLAVLNQNLEQIQKSATSESQSHTTTTADDRLHLASGKQLCIPSPVMFWIG